MTTPEFTPCTTDQLLSDSTIARVEMSVIWRGHRIECRIELPDNGNQRHYTMDSSVWKATVAVRRALVQIEYPRADLDERPTQIRLEAQAFNDIRNYLDKNRDRIFSIMAPDSNFYHWRAYFSSKVGDWDGFDLNPPMGVGADQYIAIENLLRFVEEREPIDG